MVRAVVGANWGDEGKGKITDMLGQESDIIVRFQGGANAGHTMIMESLHYTPCRPEFFMVIRPVLSETVWH